MSYPTEVQRIVDEWSRDSGFSKHSGTWHFRGGEVGIAIQCQKSQYSVRYYLNIGIWALQSLPEQWPKTYDCHVYSRLGGVFGSLSLSELMNEEVPIDTASRREGIRAVLDKELAPALAATSTVEEFARSGMDENFMRLAFITRDAPEAFDRFVEYE